MSATLTRGPAADLPAGPDGWWPDPLTAPPPGPSMGPPAPLPPRDPSAGGAAGNQQHAAQRAALPAGPRVVGAVLLLLGAVGVVWPGLAAAVALAGAAVVVSLTLAGVALLVGPRLLQRTVVSG